MKKTNCNFRIKKWGYISSSIVYVNVINYIIDCTLLTRLLFNHYLFINAPNFLISTFSLVFTLIWDYLPRNSKIKPFLVITASANISSTNLSMLSLLCGPIYTKLLHFTAKFYLKRSKKARQWHLREDPYLLRCQTTRHQAEFCRTSSSLRLFLPSIEFINESCTTRPRRPL